MAASSSRSGIGVSAVTEASSPCFEGDGESIVSEGCVIVCPIETVSNESCRCHVGVCGMNKLDLPSIGDVISDLHEIELGAPTSLPPRCTSTNGDTIYAGAEGDGGEEQLQGVASSSCSDSNSNGSNSIITCQVCCDTMAASAMSGCTGCTHRYCATCIGRYWETQIFSGHHSRLTCLHGGCGTSASDADVMGVVSFRVYRRMIYFRARDRHPAANFCPVDSCWERLTGADLANGRCGRCDGRFCAKCFESYEDDNHRCAQNIASNNSDNGGMRAKVRNLDMRNILSRTGQKKQRTHELAFRLWAMTHTKACPSCGSRIQRAKGCAHMTCIKCSAYFCWRCKGYLNADCIVRGNSSNTATSATGTSNSESDTDIDIDIDTTEVEARSAPGCAQNNGNRNNNNNRYRIIRVRERGKRSCVCDKLLTSIAYGGLISVAILGSPLFLSAAVVGGPPWLIYRVVKRSSNANNSNNNSSDGNMDGRNGHHLLIERQQYLDDNRRRARHEQHAHPYADRHYYARARAHPHRDNNNNLHHLRRRELSMRAVDAHSNHPAHIARRRQQLRRRNSE